MITPDNIKIFKSENMTNTEQGGGRMTAISLIDGQINDVFPNIPTVDTVYGASEHYKMFLGVDSNNSDVLQEAFLAIVNKPTNPKVSFILFTTGSHTDHNDASKDYLENYVVAGPKLALNLLGRQVAGQRIIIAYQRETDPMPSIGDILLLAEDETGVNLQEYVRITNIETEIRTFNSSSCGEFSRRVLNIDLNNPLSNTFSGDDATCNTISHNALIRATNVADAAKYYGISNISDNVNTGSSTITVDSIFASIVPSTQKEQPIIDQNAALGKLSTELLGLGISTYSNTHTTNAQLISTAITQKKDILSGTQTYSHVITLNAIPSDKTVSVDYMSFGKWYRLDEIEENGVLAGNGDGTVDHVTGVIVFTLSTLPDINSKLIITYQNKNEFRNYNDNYDTELQESYFQGTPGTGATVRWQATTLTEKANITANINDAIFPGSLSGAYQKNNTSATFTSDVSGNIIENAIVIGTYTQTGEISFAPAYLPDSGSMINYSYDTPTNSTNDVVEELLTPTVNGSTYTVITTDVAEPGSVEITFTVHIPSTVYTTHYEVNEPNSGIVVTTDFNYATRRITLKVNADSSYVTINYATKEISFDPFVNFAFFAYSYFTNIEQFIAADAVYGDFTVKYTKSGITTITKTAQSLSNPMLKLDMLNTEKVLDGTLYFFVSTQTNNFYEDVGYGCSLIKADGNDLLRWNTTTRDWDANVGTFDANTGEIKYEPFQANTHNIFYLISCKVQNYDWSTQENTFRVNASPLAPLSFQLRVAKNDGTNEVVASDIDGVLTSSLVNGTVDNQTGIVDLAIDESIPQKNIYYNAIGLSFLPLDADLLGLNPVRLPGNGKVPIIKQSDIVLIREEKNELLPNSLSANDTFVASVIPISEGKLIDQNDINVDPLLYSLDIATSTVTMADPLDLSAYAQPLKFKYVFDELQLVSDISIDGTIALTGATNYAYSNNATVSSILRFGDLQARVSIHFSQQTWTGVWSDERIGNNTIAQYDFVNYPVLVVNKNAIKERWLIKFTSTTTFEVIGEHLGIIANGDTSTDLAPINPNTSEPYFTLFAAGWGTGWSTGYSLRKNTVACAAPFRLARTVLSGGQATGEDNVVIYKRGDTQ